VGTPSPVNILDPGSGVGLYRWTAGNETSWVEGLKGGITWAVDPSLCSLLLERMPEVTTTREGLFGFYEWLFPAFVDCEDIYATLRLSLAAWGAANDNVRFFEVTTLCENAWQSAGTVNGTATCGRVASDPHSHPACITCPHAELVFSTYVPAAPLGPERIGAARVMLGASDEPPLVETADYAHGGWQQGKSNLPWMGGSAPLGTAAGEAVTDAYVEYSVREDQCWWYDPDFCAGFYTGQADGTDVKALTSTLVWTVVVIGIVIFTGALLWEVYNIFQLTALSWDTDGDGVVEFHEVVQAVRLLMGVCIMRCLRKDVTIDLKGRKLEWRAALYGVLYSAKHLKIARFVGVFFLMYFPPILETGLFAPCWDCNDFHAVTVQRLGQVLGLTNVKAHTNVTDELFVTNRSYGYNCSVPLQNVARYDAATDGAIAPSVMRASTYQASPRYLCPTDDDADALRVLYPTCDELLPCETAGGGENYGYAPAVNLSDPCNRYMGPYSPADATASNANFTAANGYVWKPAPHGRYVGAVDCIEPFISGWLGYRAPFRVGALIIRALLFPFVIVVFVKLLSALLLCMPFMKSIRKRNEKLQRTAARRKAEVRRMTEGGQQFAVKRQAQSEGASAVSAIEKLREVNLRAQAERDKEAVTRLLNKLSVEPTPASMGRDEGPSGDTPGEAAPKGASASTFGARLRKLNVVKGGADTSKEGGICLGESSGTAEAQPPEPRRKTNRVQPTAMAVEPVEDQPLVLGSADAGLEAM